MKKLSILPVLFLFIHLAGCATRPLAPPENMPVKLPFGAIDVNELHYELDSSYQDSMEQSFLAESPGDFDPDRDGIREYDLLALSGGGSRGAFGAGILCGWTEAGTRPDFKVVSGVSAGALQATFAFLGPKYDTVLREIYTLLSSRDIYRKRWQLAGLLSDSVNATWPLKQIIDNYLTPELLAEVARHHNEGHRLFVATTNLETSEFIIWDMGKIAASGHPDALEHYERILLASSSVPVLFPPVYFEVEGEDGQTYYEMHVDGGVYANLFFRGFMLDYEDACQDAGIDMSKTEMRLFIIGNGLADDVVQRTMIPGKALAIAATTIGDVFKLSNRSSLYRVYVLANRNGIDFNLAQIPQEYDLDFEPTDFDQARMQKLFDFGYTRATDGYPWLKRPQFLDPDEIIEDTTRSVSNEPIEAEINERRDEGRP